MNVANLLFYTNIIIFKLQKCFGNKYENKNTTVFQGWGWSGSGPGEPKIPPDPGMPPIEGYTVPPDAASPMPG